MLFCAKCGRFSEGKRCEHCGAKRLREVREEDNCFLTEQPAMWGEMLADVLTQNGIPFLTRKTLGAALATLAGPVYEAERFYVPYPCLDQAREIVEGLFSGEAIVDPES